MAIDFEAVFNQHRRHLWDLSYRITGSAADADDIVQDTFARAMQHPPARPDDPLRPWLARIATNVALDLLRKRKRRGYDGPWLPTPIETAAPEPDETKPGTERRYEMLESVTFAFLLALEALTPRQRAVLVLRDVFDYSTAEVGIALGITQTNVRTIHSRARVVMKEYDRHRCVPTAHLQQKSLQAMQSFLTAVQTRDVATIEAQLVEAASSVTDNGGEFKHAARAPVFGAHKVAAFFASMAKQNRQVEKFEIRTINGLPALLVTFASGREGDAPRMILRCDPAPDGRVEALQFVIASEKLRRIRF
jgi:RNA polymerase sigma-70 factor (ECF subfamily)